MIQNIDSVSIGKLASVSTMRVPKLHPEIEILPIDTSAISQKYVAKIGGDRQFEISESLRKFIQFIDGNRTIEEIAIALSKDSDKEFSASDVENIIEMYLIPYGLVLAENGTTLEAKQPSYLYARKRLFSQQFLRPLTDILQNLFAP